MLSAEEIEQLSRYVDGELEAAQVQALDARLAVEPRLREALELLRRIDAVAPTLAEASRFDAERVIQRALHRPARGRWTMAALAIAALVLFGVLARPRPQPVETARVDPEVLATGDTLFRASGEVLELQRGSLFIPGGTRTVVHGDARVQLHDDALVTTEPPEALTHVTSVLATQARSDEMRNQIVRMQQWLRTGQARCVTQALLTVCALEGATAWATPRHALPAAPAVATVSKLSVRRGHAVKTSESWKPEAVNDVLEKASPALLHCFESAPGMGNFEVTLRLNDDGSAREGFVSSDYAARSPLVAACVLDQLSGLHFPPGPWTHDLNLGFAAEGGRMDDGEPAVFVDLPVVGATVDVQEAGAPAQGPLNAAVTVIEYIDHDCGFCAKADATMREVFAAYPNRIRWVIKPRPLGSHPTARLAAQAALAAQAQGKFWPFHQRLLEANAPRDRAGLLNLARSLGLDVEAFDAALDGPQIAAALQANAAEWERAGIQGVPAFVINGHVLNGAQPRAAIAAEVERALQGRSAPAETPSVLPPPPASLDGLEVTTLDGVRVPLAQLTAPVTVLSFWTAMCAPDFSSQRQVQRLAQAMAANPRVRFLIIDAEPVPPEEGRAALRQRLAAAGITLPLVFDPQALLLHVNAHLEHGAPLPANQVRIPDLAVLIDGRVPVAHSLAGEPLTDAELETLKGEIEKAK